MRVIAGQYRSRVVVAPAGQKTRPTSDRLRETLFNVLAPRVEGAVFLDLYAGSGVVGIEALSRGAREAIFVEQAQPALIAIRANLASLGIRGRYALEGRGAGAALRSLALSGRVVDLVFLDPPYESMDEYDLALGLLGDECSGLLREGAVVVAEHAKKRDLAEHYSRIRRYRVLKQGDSALSFYSASAT
ncbi:MAG: 16S rRNA (guanine(966)-N(2))-methyltransferase RsmD [Silvibacterium sp.]|nr:16S rRNA (guanine(966)-N(2))-methyltransferase RsmD [Silvibacterium sp.]